MKTKNNPYCCRDVSEKHLYKKSRTYRGFTLVELIVVITILVILGTIAFINLWGFQGSARDSARISDMGNMVQGLELSLVKNGTVPVPDAGDAWVVTVSASGTVIGYQGYAGGNVLSAIKMSDTKDPSDKKYYTYVTNALYTKYEVLGLMEDVGTVAYEEMEEIPRSATTPFTKGDRGIVWIDTVYAGYETRTPEVKGSALGVLLDNGTGATKNQPVQELYNATTFTGVDVVNTATGYKAWFSSSESISGTGTALQSLQISYVNGAGLGSPSSCPTGFISVPGNTEFNQPGFCVAKYEMSYNDADAPDSGTSAGTKDGTDVALDWNTMNYNSAKIPVSMPNKYPIVNINQLHAITACQSMGAGYHLVTNNEWMTVARNIEQQGDNWSTGIVGSGGLYRGITGEANSTTSLGCDTPSSAGAGSRAYVAKPLSTDTTKFGASKTNDCDSKRQLKLSNNQIVWDIAGNVWSHVNKANSIDGSNYNLGQTSVAGCTVTNDWNEWTAGCTDKTNTSKNTSLSSVNGIGQVYYSAWVANNIFLRGGDASNSANDGVFMLNLLWTSGDAYRNVGFRCAK